MKRIWKVRDSSWVSYFPTKEKRINKIIAFIIFFLSISIFLCSGFLRSCFWIGKDILLKVERERKQDLSSY